jgi:hypothetical protein
MYKVRCKDCDEMLLESDGSRVMSGALLVHAAQPHCGCELEIEHDFDMNAQAEPLSVECLNPKCQRGQGSKMEIMAPPWLIDAYTLIFHTAHEGHRMRVTYAGLTLESPKVRQG